VIATAADVETPRISELMSLPSCLPTLLGAQPMIVSFRRPSSPGRTESPRAELAFADHPLVPVYLMLDSVARRVAFAEELANYFEAALGGMLDAALREKFYCLADAVFVL
jgi:hypothetical protein